MNPEQLLDKYLFDFGFGDEAKEVLHKGGGFVLPLWTEFDDPLVYTKYTQEDVNNIISHLSTTITPYLLSPGSAQLIVVHLDERGLSLSIPPVNSKGWLTILTYLRGELLETDFFDLDWKLCDSDGTIVEW